MSPRDVTRQSPELPRRHRWIRALSCTSGFSARTSGPHAPSTDSIKTCSPAVRLARHALRARSRADEVIGTPPPRGSTNDLSTLCAPGAPFCDHDGLPIPSGSGTSCFARRHALVMPRGFPRTQRQDASNPFLQPTFHVTSTRDSTTSGDCPPNIVGNPPMLDFETAREQGVSTALPRAAPDHLAVIRPPAAARLTARRRLRADRLPPTRERGVG